MIDKIWEKIHQEQEWGKYPSEEVIRFVAKNYYNQDRKKIKILDFGCGAGANTWFLAREGFDTYAFDGSELAIEKAKAYLAKDHLTATFQVKDGCEISYKNEYFNCIIDGFCLSTNTLPNIINMYQKIYNMLVFGGKLFSTGCTPKTTGYGTSTKIEENTYRNPTTGLITNRGVIHFFEEDQLTTILNNIGFKNIKFITLKRLENNSILEHWIATAEK